MLLRNQLLNCSAFASPVVYEGENSAPPAAPTAPWGADVNTQWMLGEAGKQVPWYESLAAGPTKEFVKSKAYSNPAVMADALFSANRMVNGNAIEVPNVDGEDPKVWATAWEPFNKRTRGESITKAEDYKFNFGKDKDGKDLVPDPGLAKFAQELAFETGLHPKRAQELIVNRWQKFAQETNARMATEAATKNETDAQSIRTKWGANFESYRAAGERAAKALQLDAGTLSAIESHIGFAPIMDLFAKLGQMSAEGKLTGGANSGQTDTSAMTAQQVQAKITALTSDPAFQAKYNDANNPAHKDAVAELEALHKLLVDKQKQGA